MPPYSTPRPTCRVMCVPSRSSSSVRGRAVACAGATGKTKTSATAERRRLPAVPPADRPLRPRRRSRSAGTGPTARADSTTSIRPGPAFGHLELRARRPWSTVRSTGVPSSAVGPHHQPDLFGLEAAHQTAVRRALDGRQRPLPPHRHQRTDQRCGEHDQLPAGADQRHARAPRAAHVASAIARVTKPANAISTSVVRVSITSRRASSAPGAGAAAPPPRRRCAPAGPTSPGAG